MGIRPERGVRIAAFFGAALGFLYLVLASPISKQTELSWAVPFGMLPLAGLLAFGAWAFEVTDTDPVVRRDGLWALATAVAFFALLRIAKVL